MQNQKKVYPQDTLSDELTLRAKVVKSLFEVEFKP